VRLAGRLAEKSFAVVEQIAAVSTLAFASECNEFEPGIGGEMATTDRSPRLAAPKQAAVAAPVTSTPTKALPLLRRALAQIDDADGWVHLGQFGQQLAKLAPDFDARSYGHKKLSDLMTATGGFEVAQKAGSLHVRAKPSGTPAIRKVASPVAQ
jgi:hypothetical protein